MSKRGPAPFSFGAVLALLLLGGISFVAALYFLGNDTRPDIGGGRSHAASDSLTGFSALYDILERKGEAVSRTSNRRDIETTEDLVILTPDSWEDAEEVDRIIDYRRYAGPTLLIAPKWFVMKLQPSEKTGAKRGWTVPVSVARPGEMAGQEFTQSNKAKAGDMWSAYGMEGRLPEGQAVQSIKNGKRRPLAKTSKGEALVVLLPGERGSTPADVDDRMKIWPVVVVAEPDLMNNWGMADRNRAMMAIETIENARSPRDHLPIMFDLTLNGHGGKANLLTLAFRPPFLAATLCLILAAFTIAWRALWRFGPPAAQTPDIALGKEQLVVNGARLLQRSNRLHLLGPPYAALMERRLGKLLGLRPMKDEARFERELDRLAQNRGVEGTPPSTAAQSLREARTTHELLRAASALKSIERTIEA